MRRRGGVRASRVALTGRGAPPSIPQVKQRQPDPFAVVAQFYDLDLEGYDEDVQFYLELALARGRSVLELGCGTGRVAVALARAGLDVVGVDVSAAMLSVARERTHDAGAELVEADMRSLELGRRFDTVLIPLGGLQHAETASDVAATLATVARHLAPGGLAVIDVEAPQPDDLAAGPQPLVEHWTRRWPPERADEGQVTKLVSVVGRPAAGLREVTWHFDVQPAEGPLRRLTQRFTLRLITHGELELAARLAGLAVTASYGDHALTAFDDDAERLVVTLEHAS